MWRKRPSAALIISILALIMAMGGAGYAAFKVPKSSVGTKQLKNGSVSTAKLKNGAVTASKMNTAGVTVPNADNAARLGGFPASLYQGKLLTAKVAPDGTLLGGNATGSHVLGVYGPGNYEVDFSRAVTGCVFVASRGSSLSTNTLSDYNDSNPIAGFVLAEPRDGVPNGVYVLTSDPSNNPIAAPFHLVVVC